eukprot:m.477884 g.477884  ORF g.477884 m.477884 type:complete len:314 (-) comp20980_c0_seq1:2200-3141(-)
MHAHVQRAKQSTCENRRGQQEASTNTITCTKKNKTQKNQKPATKPKPKPEAKRNRWCQPTTEHTRRCLLPGALEVDAAHLPAGHFAKVAHVGVAVALEREHGRVLGQELRRLEAFVIAPQAWRQSNVARLVVLVMVNIALSNHGDLAAEKLRGACVVAVELHGDAARSMAMTTGVDETDIRQGPVKFYNVLALAVWAVGASARARRTRRRLANGPVRVADNLLTRLGKRRRHIVLTSMGLGLVVDAVKVGVRGVGRGRGGHVLLKPEAKLHVVAQELGANLLVGIKHDALVAAAPKAAGVLARVARRVALRKQ